MKTLASSLRIEMVLPSLPLGGMEMLVLRLAEALMSRGHRIGITCIESRGEAAKQAEAAGVEVALVPAPGIATNLRAPALESHFRRRAPHVVHSHSGVWLKAAHAARRAGVERIIHTVHGLLDHEPWHGRALKRLASEFTDATVAVSEPLADYLLQRCGLPRSRLCTIINGIDTERFAPVQRSSTAFRTMRASVAGDWADCQLVAHVARLVPVKNQHLLLDAFRTVIECVPEARLLMAGDGPMRRELEAYGLAIGLGSHIRWLGPVTDVAEWLPAMDAFVLSSDAEGTSISILEAMASGVPVAATSVGGTPRLLEGGGAGLLVPPRDARILGDSIMRLLCDIDLRSRLAAEARRVATAEFDVSLMVARYEALYRGAGCTDLPPVAEVAQCVA